MHCVELIQRNAIVGTIKSYKLGKSCKTFLIYLKKCRKPLKSLNNL